MFAKKVLSVYIERKRIQHKKSLNEFVQATDSIINFYFDPLNVLQGETTTCENENIVTEEKEGVIDHDSLFVQEINNSGDEKNNTVVDDIDILEHKI